MDRVSLLQTMEGKNFRSGSSSRTKLYLTLLSATVLLSLTALGLSMAAYIQVQSSATAPQAGATKVVGFDVEDEEWVLNDIAKTHFQRSFGQSGRGRQPADEICNSTVNRLDSGVLEKPSAHIVPSTLLSGGLSKLRPVPIPAITGGSYSVLSSDWFCKYEHIAGLPPSANLGHVRGGVLFNRTSGFLRLPISGTYFVYSQVQFKIERNTSNVETVGYKTVACLHHGFCIFPEKGHIYMETLLQDRFMSGTTTAQFHGGVFHFPAGTEIGLMAYYSTALRESPDTTPRESTSEGRMGEEEDEEEEGNLQLKAAWYQSYLGVFLIDEVPFE